MFLLFKSRLQMIHDIEILLILLFCFLSHHVISYSTKIPDVHKNAIENIYKARNHFFNEESYNSVDICISTENNFKMTIAVIR